MLYVYTIHLVWIFVCLDTILLFMVVVCHSPPVSLTRSGHSHLTALINKAFVLTDLLFTECFLCV